PELAPDGEQRGELLDIAPAAGGEEASVDAAQLAAVVVALSEIYGTETLAEILSNQLAEGFGGEETGPAGGLGSGPDGPDGFQGLGEAGQTPISNTDNFVPEPSGPALAPDSGAIAEDGTPGTVGGNVLDNDPGGATLLVARVNGSELNVGQPVQGHFGTLTLNADGTYSYVLDNNATAVQALAEGEITTDNFTYQASDGSGLSAPATLTITVTGTNDVPVATNDSYSTIVNGQLVVSVGAGLLANDTDIDGDTLTTTVTGGPANGTLAQNTNGSFTYTPNAGFIGADSFTYEVADGNGGTDSGTVTINVTPPLAGQPTNGAAMRTSVEVGAGAVLTLQFNFLDSEFPGQLTFIDFAVVVVGDQV
ncbi:MAG: Ig-like domain-containing protein, partial [Dongiaceae bacterium]